MLARVDGVLWYATLRSANDTPSSALFEIAAHDNVTAEMLFKDDVTPSFVIIGRIFFLVLQDDFGLGMLICVQHQWSMVILKGIGKLSTMEYSAGKENRRSRS